MESQSYFPKKSYLTRPCCPEPSFTKITVENTEGDVQNNYTLCCGADTTIVAQDSTINIVDQDGNPLGTVTGISGSTTTEEIILPECPECPVCPDCETLEELITTNTSADVFSAIEDAGKDCSIQRLLLDKYGLNKYMSGAMFGTTSSVSRGTVYHEIGGVGYIFQCNNAVINIYNASTQTDTGVSIMGFGRATKIAFNGSTMAVSDSVNNRIYLFTVVNATTFTAITNWVTSLTATFAVEFNQAGTELYVGSFGSGTSISRFDLTGSLLGTITGNDTNVIDMVRVNNELWALMTTGTSGASTQRIRKIDMGTNTQISTHSLGTVTSIGTAQSFCINSTNIYVVTGLSGMSIYQYTSAVSLVNSGVLALNGSNTFGITVNPLLCNCLVVQVGAATVLTHVIYPN